MTVLLFLVAMVVLGWLIAGAIAIAAVLFAPRYAPLPERAPPPQPVKRRIPRPMPDGLRAVRQLLEEQRLRDRAA